MRRGSSPDCEAERAEELMPAAATTGFDPNTRPSQSEPKTFASVGRVPSVIGGLK